MDVLEIRNYINDRVKNELIQTFNLKVCPASIGSFKFDHTEYDCGYAVGFFIDENNPDLTLSLKFKLESNFYDKYMNLVLSDGESPMRNRHISSTDEFNDALDAIVTGWVEEYKKT